MSINMFILIIGFILTTALLALAYFRKEIIRLKKEVEAIKKEAERNRLHNHANHVEHGHRIWHLLRSVYKKGVVYEFDIIRYYTPAGNCDNIYELEKMAKEMGAIGRADGDKFIISWAENENK